MDLVGWVDDDEEDGEEEDDEEEDGEEEDGEDAVLKEMSDIKTAMRTSLWTDFSIGLGARMKSTLQVNNRIFFLRFCFFLILFSNLKRKEHTFMVSFVPVSSENG
jgi:hypothetical protein